MGWIEKVQATSFENEPIEGLFFLDGNLIAASNAALDWNKGNKYPTIVFPSGTMCPISESSDPSSPVVHLPEGDLAIPLIGSRDDAYTHVTEVAQPIGYQVRKVGQDVLEVENDDYERIHVIYDDSASRITDVVYVPNEDAAIEALHRREQIDENENTIERNAALDRYGEGLDRMEAAASPRRDQEPLSDLPPLHSLDEEPSPPRAALSPEIEHLLARKDEIITRFRELPPEHQATIGLVLVKTIMDGEWGTWLADAFARTYLAGALVPSIDRDDLRAVHFSEEDIARFSDADLATIARRIHSHYVNDAFPDELRFQAEEQLGTMGAENPGEETSPTIEGGDSSFPTNSVAKEDLIFSRPDLKAQIEALTDRDVEKIASKVGDALQEAYWTAVGTVLVLRFGRDTLDNLDMGPDE